jgi:hypothetical protein
VTTPSPIRRTQRSRRASLGAALALVLLALALPALAAETLTLQTLSTRPDKVSGGDVLVAVRASAGVDLAGIKVLLNGVDVTASFFQDPATHSLIGLVSGLALGANTMDARATGAVPDRLALKNYPLEGPIFSGPQETPYYCQTHQFRVYPLPGPLLTPAQIGDPCMVPTRVDHLARSGTSFVAFDPATGVPPGTPTTTTKTGAVVPYTVRLETGTLNRAIYQIAILDDPTVPGPDLTNHGDPGWNGRLIYTFGGGCGGGWYRQGNSTGGVLPGGTDNFLRLGYAVASSSLNVLGNNCNDITSAETLMMVKERFVEAYGPPKYTIGYGCSGGGIQQYMIADNYPGLLDGLLPQCSFPDVSGATTADARLFHHYFNHVPGRVAWTEEELRKASGYGIFATIEVQAQPWAARFDVVPGRPDYQSSVFNNVVPVDVRYDPLTNPGGSRPTHYDHTKHAFGVDPATGFARRPLDNVGIQYGLGVLNTGEITKEQFLDLNEKIGGFDNDFNFTSGRTVADRLATRAAYRTGRVLSGGGGLASVPVLDFDVLYTDLAAGDVHNKFFHFSVRERMRRANGHVDNHVMWSGVFGARSAVATAAAIDAMDRWVAAIKADASSAPLRKKVVDNRPGDVVDGCWLGGATPTFQAETQFLGGAGTSICNDAYPGFPSPRLVAGEPLRNNVVKCRLKPIDLADYDVTFSPAEVARLKAIFPTGVCNYDVPGVDQHPLAGTWLKYHGPGLFTSDTKSGNP